MIDWYSAKLARVWPGLMPVSRTMFQTFPARAIASCVPEEALSPELVIPSVFDRSVVERVAAAVAEAAVGDGVARRLPKR